MSDLVENNSFVYGLLTVLAIALFGYAYNNMGNYELYQEIKEEARECQKVPRMVNYCGEVKK